MENDPRKIIADFAEEMAGFFLLLIFFGAFGLLLVGIR